MSSDLLQAVRRAMFRATLSRFVGPSVLAAGGAGLVDERRAARGSSTGAATRVEARPRR